MSSPAQQTSRKDWLPSERTSPSRKARPPASQNGMQQPQSRSLATKNSNTQPTYDFLTGEPSPQPAHQGSIRPPQYSKQEQASQDIRAQLKALQYEVSTFKQEKELSELRHEKELRDVEKRAEADFKRAQASESESHVATHKYDALARELKESQERALSERSDVEKKMRTSQERAQILEEELYEVRTELSSQERQTKYQLTELETRCSTLQRTSHELREDISAKATELQATQQKLSQRESDVGHLECEVLRLKAQTGDADTLDVIKRELSEQVAHIKKLEATNRDYLAELKQYRKLHKSVQVVEEEKRTLEGKLRLMEDLRHELSESEMQRRRLEDERRSWTSYLQNEGSTSGEIEFDSPEAIARALVRERLETAALLEKLGGVEPQLSEKDDIIKSLESGRLKLQQDMEKLRTGGTDIKARTRLERQRALAVKEVEYLRAQLRTFDAEETTFQPESFDEHKTHRIQELEDLVDQYRKELQTLNDDSAKHEKAKNLKLNQSTTFLQKELDVHKSQLTSLQNNARTRILELRSNPTSDAAAIKAATLAALRTENAALLDQIQNSHQPNSAAVVPVSTLENARMDLHEMEKAVASKEKHMLRLKQIWTAKSQEFREAVASILGWKMDFMPNGRVRVTSMFYSGPAGGDDDDDDDSGGEENSIIFDGENGTMKISGGPESAFAHEIRGLIRFWVEERKEIPCFLAAMTLEFYEKTTRAARM
ncbi:MAG: coiled-coil domain-containing protein mad1 [Sclerophora amabilis]|nr:MAG: coiled-coil domain-containing protein mad1 [Sclerophora amabilis]